VGPRAGLEAMEKRKILPLPRLELRPLGRPARSPSLYRLRYPCCLNEDVLTEITQFHYEKRRVNQTSLKIQYYMWISFGVNII
jgi:hypothetical protein